MANNQTEILFVRGIEKTGTSSLVGMLNCHPDIFIMYEVRMDDVRILRYENQLLAKLPEARKFFRNCPDVGEPYRDLAAHLKKVCGRSYRYLGAKNMALDPDKAERDFGYKTIYAIRDLRTWLCKKAATTFYRADLDVVPAAIYFAKYVISSYKHPQCLRVKVEDLVENNSKVLADLTSFLDLDLTTHADQWWTKVGEYADEDPKTWIIWHKGHPSSKSRPEKLDVKTEITPNPFWSDILPIFDKYFNGGHFNIDEVNRDLARLDDLRKYSPLPLAKCFTRVVDQKANQVKKPTFFSRALLRMRRIKQAAQGKVVLD